ncbi:AcrR family transcriptional regulator [Hamadaea flava]|uniref:TetR/AcrR family transcriptional regulator n=1 Tax=Hamadaea flava TaxID=1742688 RepID=A0ABV8LX81_9ACTN|nr:TetR/AcrR family transcriptional regulator [Hamadaea flava]MCP2321586.1 AcrR family transcriptional regulator [Hamadaea flava]
MTTPRVRNRRGEGDRLRDELVAAAAALLEEEPADDGPSLRAVARRAGIAPQSLYLHFPDKGRLLGAVCETRFAELADELAAATGRTPTARLRAMCLAYCRFAERRPRQYRVMFTEPVQAVDPGARLGALSTFDAAVRACTGEQPADIPAVSPGSAASGGSVTTLCLWAALHGMVLLRQDRAGVPWPPIEQLVDALLAAHLRLSA